MKLWRTTLVPLSLCFCVLLAQQPTSSRRDSPIFTFGLVNGRFRRGAEQQTIKLAFLSGASDILLAFNDTDKFLKYFPHTLKATEFAEALDRFYADPKNVPIPVIHARRVVAMRCDGADSETVNAMIQTLRQSISNPKPE